MNNLHSAAQPAVDELLQKDGANLYRELGARLVAVTNDTSLGSNFSIQHSTLESATLESGFNLEEIGQRFFNNLSQAAYTVVCGSGDGHSQVSTLIDKGTDYATAAIAALLVAQLAIIPAIAAAVAAIIVKVVAKGTLDTLCQTWSASLPKPGTPTE